MATELKRLSFMTTPKIEALLDSAKKNLFYNRTKSEMIRELIMEGLRVQNTEKTAEGSGHDKIA